MKKLLFLLSLLLLVSVTTVKSQVVEVKVTVLQEFTHPLNMTTEEAREKDSVKYSEGCKSVNAVYSFNYETKMLTLFEVNSDGSRTFEKSFPMVKVLNQTKHLVNVVVLGSNDTPVNVTVSLVDGKMVFLARAKEGNVMSGFFDPNSTVVSK